MARSIDSRGLLSCTGSTGRDLLVLAVVCGFTSPGCGDTIERAQADEDRQVAELELDAIYPESFSYLSGIRELSDGTILAADPASQVLVRLDMTAGTADTIGRRGAGPQEYEGPDEVFTLPGDSTLLVDLGNGRLIVIDPDCVFVDWIPMSRPNDDGSLRTIHPRAVDNYGNLYATEPYTRDDDTPDTTAIHRIDRTSLEESRVASYWHTDYSVQRRSSKRKMLLPADEWAVGFDGSVAVVRANGYSVDWFFPDGRVVQGPANDVATFPLGETEKTAALQHMAATGTYVQSMVGRSGVQSQQMTRGIPSNAMPSLDDVEWPATLPIFRYSGVHVSPEGEAWVERMMLEHSAAQVDVFGQEGVRRGYIELPRGSHVVGFGANANGDSMVYLARSDDVGLISLERYRVRRIGE